MAEPIPFGKAAANRGAKGPRGRLRLNEPLARYTSWRVGGPADRLFEPADRDDLLAFVARLSPDEPLLWLGLGSNMLVRDGGFRGTVIRLAGCLETIQTEPRVGDHKSRIPVSRIHAEAGAHCARLAKLATGYALAGLGFMAGIPGSVGGALAMNAGAWGGETWSTVVEAEVLLRGGRTAWLKPDQFSIAYRSVTPPPDFIGYLAARFAVSADVDGSHAKAMRESLAKRKASQPVGKPSAGSTFRNPSGDFAARLIDACGLKGERVGGASVSTLHSNFILTEAGAKAADVEALIARIQAVVLERFGVSLETEIRVVGEAAV